MIVVYYYLIDVVCLIVVLIITIYHHERVLRTDRKNIIFFQYVVLLFICIAVNIARTVLFNYDVPPIILYLFTGINALLYTMLTGLLSIYVYSYIKDKDSKLLRYFLFTFIPVVVLFVCLVVNYFAPFMFKINGNQIKYMSGEFVFTFVPLYHTFLPFGLYFFNKRTTDVKVLLVSISLSAVCIINLVLHSFFHIFTTENICFLSPGSTFAYLIVYLFLQNKRSTYDEVTGLVKRKVFMKRLDSLRPEDDNIVICLIDISNFKAINSKYGQDSGDQFLRSIGNYLKSIFQIGEVYRYGGDKFVLMLNNDDNVKNSIKIVCDRFEKSFTANNFECVIPYHMGIVEYPKYATRAEDILVILEEVIKKAKSNGELIAYCDDVLVSRIKEKHHIIDILMKSIENDNVEVFYQPIYSIEKKGFYNAEALVRIRYDGKLISPGDFIPVAEETGLVIDLDMIVFSKVLLFLKKLENLGIEIDGISSNFTPLHFNNPHFADEVLNLVKTFNVDPHKIKMEITESIFITNPREVERDIRKLMEYGIRFYLDDFGTGYSNWASILNLPFDFIKIDRSLVVNGDNNNNGLVILKAVMGALNANGQEILTEGIETDSQLDLVHDLGAKFVQGFYYSKPLSQENFIEFLKNNQKMELHKAVELKNK